MATTVFDFIRVQKHTGGSLLMYVDNNADSLRIFNKKLSNLFGEPDADAYADYEGGYDGTDRSFVETATGAEIHLYSRYGEWRIGGYDHAAAVRFASWIKERCS